MQAPLEQWIARREAVLERLRWVLIHNLDVRREPDEILLGQGTL